MNASKKKAKFDRQRKDMVTAGVTTSGNDSLICPLCWEETPFDLLTLEHIVPRKCGGKSKVLTCRRCNNEQGSALDAHFSRSLAVADALQGRGTIPTTLNVNGKELVTNLQFGEKSKNFIVVDKASNPAAIDAIQEEMKRGEVPEMSCSIDFGYSQNRFETALLRAAYLVSFRCLGYQYVNHEIVQVIRRRICDPDLAFPLLGSILVPPGNCKPAFDLPFFCAHGNAHGVGFTFPVIRVRSPVHFTTTYFGAFLPAPCDRSVEFFDVMEGWWREHNCETPTISLNRRFADPRQ